MTFCNYKFRSHEAGEVVISTLCVGDCMGGKGHFGLKSGQMKYMIPVAQLEPRTLPPDCLPGLLGCLSSFWHSQFLQGFLDSVRASA